MKLRKQRHVRSCGLACVSMLADKAYNTVVEDFEELKPLEWQYSENKKSWALNYLTSAYHIRFLLRQYGVKMNKRRIKYRNQKQLPNTSILVINLRKEVMGGSDITSWHWVICHKKGRKYKILDPLRGERLFKDVSPSIHSFIKVHV